MQALGHSGGLAVCQSFALKFLCCLDLFGYLFSCIVASFAIDLELMSHLRPFQKARLN